MEKKFIKRVIVALGYSLETQKPVIRHWVDDLEVLEEDDETVLLKVGKQPGRLSKRYALYPLPEGQQRTPIVLDRFNFERSSSRQEVKRFVADQHVVLLQWSQSHCVPGYEAQLSKVMLGEIRKLLLEGASFRLNMVDELDEMASSLA
ncbi:hypothetical protein ACRCPS_18290 [Pseudomonas aeruginosa]